MTKLESILFWITVACYVGSTLFYFRWMFFGGLKGNTAERFICVSGLILNVATIGIRVYSTGHLPVKNAYELNLVLAVLTVATFLIIDRKVAGVRKAGIVAMPFAFICLGLGLTIQPDLAPLTPAYKSSWLVVHVVFALLATACFVFATGSSLLFILKSRFKEADMPLKYRDLPDLTVLDELSFKLVLVGFLADTIMLLSGSIWAKMLWGSFWSWDPVESWSLISWLAYGLYIHLRVSLRWAGKKIAYTCIVCLILNLLSFWFIGLITPDTYHNLEQVTTPWIK